MPGPCICGHSSSSSSRCRPSVAWGFLAGSRLFEGSAAAAAPSSRHRETYSKLFLGDFRRDVPAPGKRLFWTPFVLQGHGVSPSGRALALWAQQQQQQQQSLSPFSSMVPEAAFLKGQLHQQQQQLPVASIEKRIASFFWEISEGTFRPRDTHILDTVRPSGPWCFPVREGRVFVGTAAGSSRQQAAAGSSKQQQAAAGISRQQQRQADAAVSATAALQQLAASQQPASSQPRETYSKLFVGDFRRDVPAPFSSMGFPCRKPPFWRVSCTSSSSSSQ